jgi:two-component system LytT family response regulator
MIKLVIIDNELDARITLKNLLQDYCPDLEIIGEADDVPTAVALIRNAEPDIVLLDIHLDNATGFDVLDKFSNPTFRVVFITAFDTYALKAFRYYALDYLLKPIDPNLLVKAIDKVKSDLEQKQFFQQKMNYMMEGHRSKSFDKIALPSAEGVSFLAIDDILYLHADGNYCSFFMQNGEKYMVSKPLKYFEEILPQNTFYRLHQSYIINVQFVKKILKEDGGYALLSNGKKIPISRRRKEGLISMMLG